MDTIEPSAGLVSRLRGGAPVLVLTGAGMSAESGLATFRGPEGMWEGNNPLDLATPEAFERDPLTVWRFYAWRRQRAAAAEPNAGHRAVVALERRLGDLVVVTQNVDGLHERAGSTAVIRLHGSLWTLRCTREQRDVEDHRDDLGPLPPRCPCGALLRPGVVWFGEPLPPEAFAAAAAAARRAGVVLVIGTSGAVYPAAALPGLARAAGAYVAEINVDTTALSDRVDERIAGRAAEVLPALARACGALAAEASS